VYQQEDLELIVAQLRATGTDQRQVEVKTAGGGLPKDVWETVSAFSNGDGGLIILGLDEARGFAPTQGFDAVKIRDAMVSGFRPRKPSDPEGPVTPPAQGAVDIAFVAGTSVVIAEVEELPADQKPSFVTSRGIQAGSFERQGDGDHRMNTHAIFLLSTNRTQPQDDREPVAGASREDLDSEQVSRFITRLRRTRPRAVADLTDDRDILVRFNVLSPDKKTPTLAGLLALGRYPQHMFPQLMISFASYPGHDKVSVEGSIRMLDRRVIEGPIPVMVDDAVDSLLANLKVRRVSRGAGAADEAEIPVDALREAVVNALAHRDYSSFALGEQVRIEVFPDRVEIVNPGGIFGGRRDVDLYDGSSRSRNAVLSTLLTEVPFPDRDETVSENAGSGIPRMTGVLGLAGLAAPKFVSDVTSMRVILDRHGILTPELDGWFESIGARTLDRYSRIALAQVSRGIGVHDKQLRSLLGIDTDDAKQVLRGLVSEGWLSYPRGPGQSYRFGPRLQSAGGSIPLEPFGTGVATPPRPPGFANLRLDERLLALLRVVDEADIHSLAELADSTVNALRPRLRVLIDQGAVVPTAPPQSKNRRYRLGTG